jgi:hypothetical protein
LPHSFSLFIASKLHNDIVQSSSESAKNTKIQTGNRTIMTSMPGNHVKNTLFPEKVLSSIGNILFANVVV